MSRLNGTKYEGFKEVPLTETMLTVDNNKTTNGLKDSITSVVDNNPIDTAASLIPGITGAVTSYKQNRFERNVRLFANELAQRMEELRRNIEYKTDDQKSKIDKLFEIVMDTVIMEQQEEKVKFMTNGFINLTANESFTEDFVITYYDLISALRLVDISVLKLYSRSAYLNTEDSKWYLEVMKRHGINFVQYESVRTNLYQLGLLTTKKESEHRNNLDSLIESVKKINDYLDMRTNGKTTDVPKLKDPKPESSDSYQISKYGRDFYRFFLEIPEEE